MKAKRKERTLGTDDGRQIQKEERKAEVRRKNSNMAVFNGWKLSSRIISQYHNLIAMSLSKREEETKKTKDELKGKTKRRKGTKERENDRTLGKNEGRKKETQKEERNTEGGRILL
jgi:hypothetical protein